MRYETYILGELFQIKKVKGLPFKLYDSGAIPYVTGTRTNNGVIGYVSADEDDISKENCITVDPITGICTYQSEKFVGRGFSGASINLLYLDKLDEKVAMYLMGAIEKYATQIASYAQLFNSRRLSKATIILPTLDKLDINSPYSMDGFVPDWDYMQEKIAELEQYLIAAGLNDYELTDEDREALATKLKVWGGIIRKYDIFRWLLERNKRICN